MRRVTMAVAVVMAIAALVQPLSAQAVCSAPHSSPTLTSSGAVGTLPAGAGWAQLSIYQQRSSEFFGPDGDRRSFLADSEFLTRSVFLTGAIGIVEGLELWAQTPVHRLTVESAGGGSESTGVGDVRLAARFGPELFRWGVPVAVRIGVKLPGSEFPVDATVLPLTEGQRDVEVSVESGYDFDDLPIYVVGWTGYRLRAENEEAAREPGDELFAHLATGGTLGAFAWEMGAEWLSGSTPRAQGFELPGDRRRLLQLLPTLGLTVAGGRLELSAQIPVSGRNLPTGPGLSLGYRTTWGSVALTPDRADPTP